MCGLAGMAGNYVQRHQDAFKELLYISALRGRDGTGVAAINTHKGRHSIFKSVDEPNDYLKKYGGRSDFLSSYFYNVMLGHTRWATIGKVKHQNVHPFDVGNLIGAHNGTLESGEYWNPKTTDSELFFQNMEKDGIIPTLEKLTYRDAFAISVYSKKDKALYLATNGQRPLAVGFCKHSDVIFWASDYSMIHLVAKRNQIAIDVVTLASGSLYEIPIDSIKKDERNWTAEKFKVEERPQYTMEEIQKLQEEWRKKYPNLTLVDNDIPF